MNLKNIVTTNMEMKLLSLLLAAVLGLLAVAEVIDELEIPLKVSFVNTPSGLFAKSKSESGCLVSVEGPRILLLRQKLKGVSLRLDLAGAGEGEVVFSGIESSVKLIQGVKLIKRYPLKVELYR